MSFPTHDRSSRHGSRAARQRVFVQHGLCNEQPSALRSSGHIDAPPDLDRQKTLFEPDRRGVPAAVDDPVEGGLQNGMIRSRHRHIVQIHPVLACGGLRRLWRSWWPECSARCAGSAITHLLTATQARRLPCRPIVWTCPEERPTGEVTRAHLDGCAVTAGSLGSSSSHDGKMR